MAQEYRFQYKVATSEKNPLAPALTRQGARERGFATQHWAYAKKTGEWARCLLKRAGLARAKSLQNHKLKIEVNRTSYDCQFPCVPRQTGGLLAFMFLGLFNQWGHWAYFHLALKWL